MAGNIKIKTEFKWVEYVSPPTHSLLNKKSLFRVIVHEATFLKDSDFIGKQDPFIRFVYDGKTMDTDVKDDAGKSAKWDETFQFPNILQRLKANESLTFQAYDKDLTSSDLLCKTEPLDYIDLLGKTDPIKMKLEMFDDKGNKCGKVTVST